MLALFTIGRQLHRDKISVFFLYYSLRFFQVYCCLEVLSGFIFNSKRNERSILCLEMIYIYIYISLRKAKAKSGNKHL